MNVPETIKNTVYEIERHCNNYFNPKNDPCSKIRNYPPAFIELACKISQYRAGDETGNATSIRMGDTSISFAPNTNSWQKAFSQDLAIYKRVKFL